MWEGISSGVMEVRGVGVAHIEADAGAETKTVAGGTDDVALAVLCTVTGSGMLETVRVLLIFLTCT
jgi:hypothetical protein